MINKVFHKAILSELNEIRINREYWLSRTPEERIDAVEFYRKQVYGTLPRLQRVVTILNGENGEVRQIGKRT